MANKRAGILLIVCAVFGVHQNALSGQTSEIPARKAIGIAQEAGLPLGIVLDDNLSLCKSKPTTPDNDADLDAKAKLIRLAQRNGYTLEQNGGLLLRPLMFPNSLNQSLAHRWEKFPELQGTMSYMGAVLNGWLITLVEPGRGFAIHSASATDAHRITLPASSNISSIELAQKIVSLDRKGIWIVWKDKTPTSHPGDDVHVRVFSYTDDTEDLRFWQCP